MLVSKKTGKSFKTKQRKISKRSIQIELEWWWIIRTSYTSCELLYLFFLFFLNYVKSFKIFPGNKYLTAKLQNNNIQPRDIQYLVIRTYYINHNYVNNLKINCEGGAKAFDYLIWKLKIDIYRLICNRYGFFSYHFFQNNFRSCKQHKIFILKDFPMDVQFSKLNFRWLITPYKSHVWYTYSFNLGIPFLIISGN